MDRGTPPHRECILRPPNVTSPRSPRRAHCGRTEVLARVAYRHFERRHQERAARGRGKQPALVAMRCQLDSLAFGLRPRQTYNFQTYGGSLGAVSCCRHA